VQRELLFGVGARSVSVLDARDFPAESALMAILQESPAPVALSRDAEPFVLLPRHDREWLEMRDVMLAAPIRLRDGTIGGVALLGSRRGGGTYTRIDRWFISTLLAGAAAAWIVADEATESDLPAFECERCGLVSDATPLPCGCGAAAAASLPRRLAGKFVVQRRLGAGGMGVVYLARDTTLDRDVALKTLPAMSEGSVARLRDEARAMAALNHRSLATIYGLEMWRRTPVLVVEYFAGGTLADRLARDLLSRDEVLALGLCLADALIYMHERGVLHRDLKPANIGVTADGEMKLLDFGLSADFGAPAGTAAYLPPEALAGGAPDTAVDLWGLATVLLHSGGESCEALAPFFARALAQARETRFQSGGEVRAALLRIRHDIARRSDER
jgi:tRNA A-37 threonylcarbamoyl transferase component Bud32